MVAQHSQGICARSNRVYISAGAALARTLCVGCRTQCFNWRCKGCRKSMCRKCFTKHLGTAPNVAWMFADGAFFSVAKADPMHWSSMLCLDDALDTFASPAKNYEKSRHILLRIYQESKQTEEKTFSSAAETYSWLL